MSRNTLSRCKYIYRWFDVNRKSIPVVTCATWHHQIVSNLPALGTPSGQNVLTPQISIPQRTEQLTHKTCYHSKHLLHGCITFSEAESSNTVLSCSGITQTVCFFPREGAKVIWWALPDALWPFRACAESAHLPVKWKSSTIQFCLESHKICHRFRSEVEQVV